MDDANNNMWITVKSKNSRHLAYHITLCKTSSKFKHIKVKAKGDSAASNHYCALRDSMVLDTITDDPIGITVTLSNKLHITSIIKGHPPLNILSSIATETKK